MTRRVTVPDARRRALLLAALRMAEESRRRGAQVPARREVARRMREATGRPDRPV